MDVYSGIYCVRDPGKVSRLLVFLGVLPKGVRYRVSAKLAGESSFSFEPTFDPELFDSYGYWLWLM